MNYSFRRWFKTQRVAKVITIFIFLAVLFAVGFGIYSFFRWQFGLIQHDAYLRVALPIFFYEELFLIVFVLVLVSGFTSGIFTLFRGAEKNLLVMSSPRFKLVFWRAYRQTFLSSLWPVIVITIPAFLGSSAVFPVSFLGGVLVIASIIFLAALAVSVALLVFLVSAAILYGLAHYFGRAWFGFGKSALLAIVVLAAGLFVGATRAAVGNITSIFAATDSSDTASRIDIILQRFSIFPSHLVTLTLWNAQQGSFGSAAVAALGLGLLCAASLGAYALMGRIFLPLWQVFQEGKYEARAMAVSPRRREGPIAFPKFFKSPLGALFEKEGMMLFRNTKNLLWFFFLFVLWAMQVVLEFFIRRNLIHYGEQLISALALVEALELATAVYFVSVLILRFVFPAFSSERKTAWVFGTAPIKMQSVFWSKFLFYAILLLCLGIAFSGLNFFIIQAALTQAAVFMSVMVLLVIFLVAFGLGLGAIFPNFESDDPEVLSTSLSGLSFTFGSLIYGGIGSYLFYRFLIDGSGVSLAEFSVLTVVLTLVLFSASLRALKRFEFVKVV